MRSNKAFVLCIVFALILSLCLCPAVLADADETGLTFDPDDVATKFDDPFMYMINSETPHTVSGVTTQYYINVRNTKPLTLKDVSIKKANAAALLSDESLELVTVGRNIINGITCKEELTISGNGVLDVGETVSCDFLKIDGGTLIFSNALFEKFEVFNINGGSVILNSNADTIDKINAAEDKVYLTVIGLSGAGENVSVSSAVCSEKAYNFTGAQTDAEEMLYFYLPTGTKIDSITTMNGDIYVGEAITGDADNPGAYMFTKYTPPAPDYPYSVNWTSAAGGYTNDYNGLNITAAGDYEVSMNYSKVSVPIVVSAKTGDVNITLNGVNVEIPGATESPAVNLTGDCAAEVRVILKEGTRSTLKGGGHCAAIQKTESGKLIIKGYGALAATGGTNAAAIGSGDGADVSGIAIISGTVTVDGGENAAGIGSGKGGDARDILVSGGTIIAQGGKDAAGIGAGTGGKASDISITGGNVNSSIPEGCESVPVVITLDGVTGSKNVSVFEMSQPDSSDAYGIDDVKTLDGKLYFWLRTGSVVESVTIGDKEYTGAEDYVVPDAGGDVVLYRPQYDAVSISGGTEKAIPNTYRDGLIISENAKVRMAEGLSVAKAPIFTVTGDSNVTVMLDNLNVDTKDRDPSSCLVYAPTGSGLTEVFVRGKNEFSAITLREADVYKIKFIHSEANCSINSDRLIVQTTLTIPLPKALGFTKPISKQVLMNLPGITLDSGASNGEGHYSIVKSGKNMYAMELSNASLTLDGLIPAYVHMTIDADSTLRLKEDSIMTLMGDSTITGEGNIVTDGVFIGDADVNIRHKIDVSAMFGHDTVVTGLDNGYANRGDTVTVSIVDENDFLHWSFEPSLPDDVTIDLTQKSVSFKVDKGYSVKAIYKTRVSGVAFEKKNYEAVSGEVVNLAWSVLPSDATDKTVVFASDNEDVAQVNEAGEVYAVSAGTANITVTTNDLGFTDKCAVTVDDPPIKPLDVGIAAVKVGSSMKLNPPLGYEGEWSVKDSEFAVIVDNKKLKAIKLGETTLTFTVSKVVSKRPSLVSGKTLSEGESVSIPLMVRKKKELVQSVSFGAKKLYLAPGEEYKLSPTLKPKTAVDLKTYYAISDLKVARLSDDSVIAMNEGTATLTATASSLASKKLTLIVTSELQELIPVKKKLTVKVAQKVQCSVLTKPLGLNDVEITWSSKNANIAAVDALTGEVTGVKKGKTTITAKSKNAKASFNITVK